MSAVDHSGIRVEDVWKSYRSWPSGTRTLRGILSRRVPLFARGEERWALRGVGLEVRPGETVGVIGPNGAGKSTLLRLAAGLGRPTRGSVLAPEATAAVLSLGDTVDLSLSGRENAMTAAIVAGMSPRQARARMADVFEFAELETFADAPVRTYSEGMKLRLAFGVVAQLEPRALLIDEVLSVGDLRFQAKCAERVRALRDAGAAVLITSHYLDQVAAECDRVAWLQSGSVRMVGETDRVIAAYEDEMRSQTIARTPAAGYEDRPELELRRNRFGSQEVTIDSASLIGPDGEAAEELASGEPLTVRVRLTSHLEEPLEAHVAVAIRRSSDGIVCADTNSEREGLRVRLDRGGAMVTAGFARLDLVPGDYRVDVGVYEAGWRFAYDYHWSAYPLRVRGPAGGDGVLQAPVRWDLSAGSGAAAEEAPRGAEPDATQPD